MNAGALLDEQSAAALDFAWLRAAASPSSDYGERLYRQIVPFRRGQEAAAEERARRIAQIAAELDRSRLDAARDAFRNAPDVNATLARASMGDTLADAQFLELQRWFDAMTRVDGFIAGCDALPRCLDLEVEATSRELELGRAGKFGFYLADAFDNGLAAARDAANAAQAEYDAVRSGATARVAAALGRDDLGAANEFIVMRRDLPPGGLPPSVRTVREAPTYVLCELDIDEATIQALARRDDAAARVAADEAAVRRRLTGVIRSRASALDAAALRCGEIDVLIAAARFTAIHRCEPAAMESGVRLAFAAGRFLPLEALLEREGRSFTPLAVDLRDAVVLTGPNMGGKSVCLRTCAFVALLANFGLPVPARHARVALFDEISWLGIGGDGTGSLLSSFAREVVRLRDILSRATGRVFLAVDEFARTTTPYEGKALLVALLERLRELDACAVVATHLSGIARASGARHYAVRGLRGVPDRPPGGALAEALASIAASMDYTVAEVTGSRERSSDAIALAALLGLDEAFVHDAYTALSES